MAIYHCRVRKYRKSAHLSQLELALLVGLRSQGTISDIEAGVKRPSAAVALGCELVLDVPARDLFPRIYRKVESEALKRSRRLKDELQSACAHPSQIASVAALITRLEDGPSNL